MNLAKELDKLLKDYIKKEGYYDSGNLYKSIKFTVSDKNGTPKISLEANDYIQYLDNGMFLDNFFEQSNVQQIIAEYMVDSITKSIQS